jgi:acyl carrier protein
MSMNEALATRVRGVVVKVAKLPAERVGFSPDADLFRELGVESTAALDLLLSLEEEFNVSIPDQRFGDARTLRALTTLIGELG